MRIVILTQYFYPEMGAPQNRLLELASGLRQRGWAVDVFTALPNYPTGKIFEGYQRKFLVSENLQGFPVHRYWLWPSNSSRAIPRILSMLSFCFTSLFAAFRIRKMKPDFLMVESPPLPLAGTGLILSRFAGARFVMNVSDLWPLTARELGAISEGRLYKFLLKVEGYFYRKADLCTGQSQEIVDYISSKRDKNGVLLLRNGVATSRFSIANQQERTFRIIYAGLLGVAQGILQICKEINFRELGLELHIYGAGTERDQIEHYLSENNQKGIEFKGLIERDHIPETLQQYEAALAPLTRSIYGAVPSKIYESMAAGLPLFFIGEGEGATIVANHQVGWVIAPGDWQTFRDHLLAFRAYPLTELSQLKERSRKVAREFFDRDSQITAFNNQLKRVISNE